MRPSRRAKHIKSHFVLSLFRVNMKLCFSMWHAFAARCFHDYIVFTRLARLSSVRPRAGFPILLCKRINARELFVTFYLLLVENGIVRDCNNTYNPYPDPPPQPTIYILCSLAYTRSEFVHLLQCFSGHCYSFNS